MSIENTCPTVLNNKNDLMLQYEEARVTQVKELKQLVMRFNDDLKLRSFFLLHEFTGLLDSAKKNKNYQTEYLLEYIKYSKTIPCVTVECEVPFFQHMWILTNSANSFFEYYLKKDINYIFSKAEEIGLIELVSYIDRIAHRGFILDVISPKKFDILEKIGADHECIQSNLYYKLSDEFHRIWITDEHSKGKLLELWVYHFLKDYFELDTSIKIYYNVIVSKNVTEDTLENLLSISEYSGETSSARDERNFTITDIDVLMEKNGEKICAIECKNEKETHMEDALKLYGTMCLLNIKKGILFARNFNSREKAFLIFDNLLVIPKAVDDLNSLNGLIDFIEK